MTLRYQQIYHHVYYIHDCILRNIDTVNYIRVRLALLTNIILEVESYREVECLQMYVI